MVNIEIEGPSTSIGPSELVPTDAARELGSSPVEVIRYQPAQVEYHDIPSCSDSGETPPAASVAPTLKEEDEEEEELGEEQGERVGLVSGKDKSDAAMPLPQSPSTDGDPSELEALMHDASPSCPLQADTTPQGTSNHSAFDNISIPSTASDSWEFAVDCVMWMISTPFFFFSNLLLLCFLFPYPFPYVNCGRCLRDCSVCMLWKEFFTIPCREITRLGCIKVELWALRPAL